MRRIGLTSFFVVVVGVSLMADDAGRPRRRRQQPKLPEGFAAHRDQEYAKVGEKSLLLDVYAPREAKRSLPLVVWVHGGAWRAGSKDRCGALWLLEKGYVVASINYRLSQEAIFPAQIEDCKAAIRWLRANSRKFHIDPDRIGVWGSSAGGHLAALLGTTGDVKELEGQGGNLRFSSRVQAVVDFFGPTDFLQMDAHALESAPFKHDAADSPESKLIGGAIQENKDKVARANPIRYASADDPDFLIVHGDKDPLVPLHQSQLLNEALLLADVNSVLKVVEGAGHGFRRSAEVNELVEVFLEGALELKR